MSRPATQSRKISTLPSTYRLRSPLDETPLRRRASGALLALGINLLVLLALLTLGVRIVPQKPSGAIVVDLLPRSDEATAEEAQRDDVPTEQPRPQVKPPPIVIPVPPTIAPPPTVEDPPPWIELSRADMAAGDLRNVPKPAPGENDSEEVGRAPNGEALYAAEWARRPTNAEVGGYIPRNAPEGWGMIACRTIPNNRVDDCIELGQSPSGSRLASAVRQAAWQFRVRPPRKNGRPMIGVWVRIRIDYTRSGG